MLMPPLPLRRCLPVLIFEGEDPLLMILLDHFAARTSVIPGKRLCTFLVDNLLEEVEIP